MPPAIDKSGGQ